MAALKSLIELGEHGSSYCEVVSYFYQPEMSSLPGQQMDATPPAENSWSDLPENLVKRILHLAMLNSGGTLQQWLHMSLVCRYPYDMPATLPSRFFTPLSTQLWCTVLDSSPQLPGCHREPCAAYYLCRCHACPWTRQSAQSSA